MSVLKKDMHVTRVGYGSDRILSLADMGAAGRCAVHHADVLRRASICVVEARSLTGEMKMKRTVFVLVTGVVCLALVTAAHAQQTNCVTTRDAISGVYLSTCTPSQPAFQHRYNPEAERALRDERNYQNNAYEYELRRLEQENRR
jgi:hypothetical protein